MTSSDTDKILKSIRRMAWQRAKGELLSILETYYTDYNPRTAEPMENGYKAAKERIDSFIADFEANW